MSKELSNPPKLNLKIIGPGIVLIAMGLGSGEFVLWPYLIASYGFGVLWGALIGITFQFFVSNETGRYTLATGGSVYEGFYKLNKYLPIWFILSTYLSFAWPGIIGSGGIILGNLLNIEETKYLTILMLFSIGLLLTFGGKVYSNLERLQKLYIFVSIPILILIAAILIDKDTIPSLVKGFLGSGEGYKILPKDISILSFLGAVAYSGAGGNLVASHSFYVQDEGLAMAKHADSQISLERKSENVYKGVLFENSKSNLEKFRSWFKISFVEQLFSFWFIGLLTIILLSIISYELVYPFEGKENLDFIFEQSSGIEIASNHFLGKVFLIIGAIFLYTTQLGIFETTSRIMSENIKLVSGDRLKKFNRSQIFFFFLWIQVISASVISFLDLSAPIHILLIGTTFSALSMFVLSILILKLNTSDALYDEVKPGKFKRFMLLAAFLFFGFFLLLTLKDIIL